MALPGMDPGLGLQPEWSGQHSAKFADRESGRPIGRKVVETDIRNGVSSGLARNGFGQYFSDVRGLDIVDGKKILPVPPSDVAQWRPSKKPMVEPGHNHYEKPEGRRAVDAPPGKMSALCEKRHLRQVESKEEHGDRPLGPRIIHRENGLRAADQPAREIDITFEMQRKVGPYSLRDQRAGIGCKVLGDKGYKHPEYSERFFQMGNLITGAGFVRGSYPKTEPRNNEGLKMVPMAKRDGPVKSFEEKQAEMFALEARMEVEELTMKWESSVLKTSDAKYDFVDSEDEAPGDA